MNTTGSYELQETNFHGLDAASNPNEPQVSSIDLTTRPEIEIPSLPPTDHGKAAYLVLAGCTFIQAPVWGFSLSFGVFQEYYTTHSDLEGPAGAIATAGTTLNGLMYLMMPLTFTFLTRYPRLRPYCGPLGLAITATSLILSAYATKVWHLIASQGVMCAIGSCFMFSPTSIYLDEWFISRKGLAYGTIWAGKAAAGAIFPFLMSSLLTRFGPRTTLQAWAISLVLLTAPLFFCIKPRIPVSSSVNRRPLTWTFLKYSTFWMMQLGNIIQAFGYLLPTTYLASYAHTLGLSEITGAVLIAIFSLASVPGGIVIGFLGDRFSATTVILISSIGSTVAIFLCWGLATHLTLLLIFVIIYGFFAGGFSSTYPGVLKDLKKIDDRVDTSLVMGLLLGGRGLGFVIGGPVSSALLATGWTVVEKARSGYGTQYGPVIICTGVSALLGGWGWIWRYLRPLLA